MMDIEWWYFIAGVVIGWITKIPIFLYLYREWQREMLDYYEIHKRVLELMGKNK